MGPSTGHLQDVYGQLTGRLLGKNGGSLRDNYRKSKMHLSGSIRRLRVYGTINNRSSSI